MKQFYLLILLFVNPYFALAQTIECSYPVIFIHGYTGSDDSFSDVYNDTHFSNIWGGLDDVYHAVLNATDHSHIWGADGIQGTSDDDVLIEFDNETNVLAPGCVYAINFNNFWNEDENNPEIIHYGCDSPGLTESDSNESAILKQGYAIGKMIEEVLEANPGKNKVILVGHSMGGLTAREYLQRTEDNNNSSDPKWWVAPQEAGGHKVTKLVTTATPHRGSNFFGDPWPLTEDQAQARDGLPDPFSEATRDLRYSYAWGCGFLGLESCPGAYLFGGEEDDISGYWNEDVDCDGDESSSITGINIAGAQNEWDGTYDNPDMPLPTDIRYTWITSDILLDNGDGIVALGRQWLFNGTVPSPDDGVAYRLTDTLLTDLGHLSVNSDVDVVVRGLDEGDYPIFAWDIQMEDLYGGLVQRRSANPPEGVHTTDPDWFKFEIPAGSSGDLTLHFNPHPSLGGRIDFFSNTPSGYTGMTSFGDVSQTFAPGNPTIYLTINESMYTAGNMHYFRVIHDGIGTGDWSINYDFEASMTGPLPVELMAFNGRITGKTITLDWSTSSEHNSKLFEIYRSHNGIDYEKIGEETATGNLETRTDYAFIDPRPLAGDNYYRLKQIDRDGAAKYSNIVILRFEKQRLELHKVYPNPAGRQLHLEFFTHSDQAVQFCFGNLLGQQIKTYIHDISPGGNKLSLDISDLPDGLYILEIRQGQNRKTIRVVKKK